MGAGGSSAGRTGAEELKVRYGAEGQVLNEKIVAAAVAIPHPIHNTGAAAAACPG